MDWPGSPGRFYCVTHPKQIYKKAENNQKHPITQSSKTIIIVQLTRAIEQYNNNITKIPSDQILDLEYRIFARSLALKPVI